jgi:hypothetical protein
MTDERTIPVAIADPRAENFGHPPAQQACRNP